MNEVFQYAKNEHFKNDLKSILLTILPRISILLLCHDGRQCMELILCRVVESSCLPTHNIVPHVSWHDLPCHRTTKKYADFPIMVISQLLLRKFWIQAWFCLCQQYLCLLHIAFECIQVYMIEERCWFSQINLFVEYFPHQINILFLSSQFECHPHTQIRITLFHGCTNKHSQLEAFSQPYFIRIFSNCLSHNSPAKG